jgi:hypothetical protein
LYCTLLLLLRSTFSRGARPSYCITAAAAAAAAVAVVAAGAAAGRMAECHRLFDQLCARHRQERNREANEVQKDRHAAPPTAGQGLILCRGGGRKTAQQRVVHWQLSEAASTQGCAARAGTLSKSCTHSVSGSWCIQSLSHTLSLAHSVTKCASPDPYPQSHPPQAGMCIPTCRMAAW